MFGYYFVLALRSLRRNVALTVLIILAIGVGIGASMTTLSIFRVMSGDPIPEKSHELFTPQIDNYGPAVTGGSLKQFLTSDQLPVALTYTDAMGLMRAHAAERQAAMYGSSITLVPPNPAQLPLAEPVVATGADFFTMFDVPFEYGAPWSTADDDARAPLVVLPRSLNDRLFGGADSVGRTLSLNGTAYRVVGVIQSWDPTPRFYMPFAGPFGGTDQLYMPFNTAIAQHLPPGGVNCLTNTATGRDALLHSECVWISFWAELPTSAAERGYRAFLTHYAADQQRIGRFNWPPRVALRDVPQWLTYNHVVSNDIQVLVLVSFAFLLVCLLNGVGLMLAKFMARSAQVCIRRALGADSPAIASQCLVEAGLIGLVGGVVGIGLTMFGLWMAQGLFVGPGAALLTRLDAGDVLIAVALSVGATLLAGLYPTWRATRVAPAWHLKIQ